MDRGEIESILQHSAVCESGRRVDDVPAFSTDEEKGEWRRSIRTWHDTIAAINNAEIREAAFCRRYSGTYFEFVGSKVSRTCKDRRNACGERTGHQTNGARLDVCRGGEQDVLFFATPSLRGSKERGAQRLDSKARDILKEGRPVGNVYFTVPTSRKET